MYKRQAILINSCKKDSSVDTSDVETQSTDQADFSSNIDATSDLIDSAIHAVPTISGLKATNEIPIERSLTHTSTVTSTHKVLTIVFENDNYQRISLKGTVVVTLPLNKYWKDQGAVLTANFNNLKITRIKDGKSIVLNGELVRTNVSGGLVKNLASLQTITRTITSDGMNVSFDNGTARTWQIAKKKVFTYDNGIVITISGTHESGTITGIVEWGVNRKGVEFTSTIVSPIVVKQSCDFRITSGTVNHKTENYSATVQFGLDKNGNVVSSCPSTGETYYKKIQATKTNGATFTVIRPYYH